MKQRDLELLSSYLDGQLRPSDSSRLEARLSSDPELRAVLSDLRSARGLLRQLPMRKAPRNFMLTPKMVGKNPPLPRAYPAFRFVTTIATLLFFFTVGLNFLAPQLASQSPAFGMGGGGAPEVFSAQAPAPAATEAPAEDAYATEAPAIEAPAAEPPAELAPLPTATASIEESTTTRESEAAAKEERLGMRLLGSTPSRDQRFHLPGRFYGRQAYCVLIMRLMSDGGNRWRQKEKYMR
jgi:anti-sigma factor RsiW